jgi:hypothetical protein
MGKPALLWSQARLEQNGCDHAFRSADEQRGQRRRVFQCAGSVFATERSTAESCNEGPHMSFLSPCPCLLAIDAISNALTTQQCGDREQFGRSQSGCRRKLLPDGYLVGLRARNARTRPIVSHKILGFLETPSIPACLAPPTGHIGLNRSNPTFMTQRLGI